MHQSLMDASVGTDSESYGDGEEAEIAVTVADGVGPVEGVTVRLLLTSPNGAALGGSSITGAEGIATIKHRIDAARGGVGTCAVEAVASKRWYESVTALASFRISD